MVKRLLLGFVFAFLLLGMASAGVGILSTIGIDISYPVNGASYASAISNFSYGKILSGYSLGSCWYSLNGEVHAIADCNLGTESFDSPLADGTYTLIAYINSSNGVGQADSEVSFLVDTTAPVTTATGVPDGWTNESVQVSLSATDDVSGVAYTYHCVDQTNSCSPEFTGNEIDVTNEGISYVKYFSVDNVGNVEETQTVIVKIDKTAPITTDDAPSGWHNTDVTVTLNCFDELSGCAHIYYHDSSSSLNPASVLPYWTEGNSVVLSSEGYHTLSYYSIDGAGNAESPAKTAANVVQIDKTAPTISDNYDYDGIWTNVNQTVTFSPSDGYGSGIASVLYCEGSGCVPASSVPYDGSYYLDFSSNQDTIVRYIAFDVAGNSSETGEFNVKIDFTIPIVTLISPESDSAFGATIVPTDDEGGIPLTFQVSDLASIDNCVWTINSADENLISKVITDEDNTYHFYGSAGKYYWNVTCTDSAGNAGTSETRTFTILSDSDFGEGSDSTDLTNEANISSVMSFYVSTEYGMINWTGPLDLSSGFDWSQCIKISENNVSVDSVMCPELNSSATIMVYNLNWTNPRVLRNGEVCSSPFCSEISYDSENGTFVFSVSGFSEYTTDETPVIVVSSSGGGGGGGDGSACYSNWTCGAWGACVDGLQTRICTLSKTNCFHSAKPVESQTCTVGGAEQPTGPTTETTTGEAGAGGVAGITGAVIGALGGGWTVALIFIAGIFGVAVFLRLREAKIAGEPVKITPDGYKKS